MERHQGYGEETDFVELQGYSVPACLDLRQEHISDGCAEPPAPRSLEEGDPPS